jgi:hypothetical protein
MSANNPYREDVKAWIETLYQHEPHHSRDTWGVAYEGLRTALLHARQLRRYCAVPAAILAAVLVIVLHGEVWDLQDAANLFGVEAIVLLLLHFVLTKIFVVLAYEDNVQTLLRYYGATDVPYEPEAIQ